MKYIDFIIAAIGGAFTFWLININQEDKPNSEEKLSQSSKKKMPHDLAAH